MLAARGCGLEASNAAVHEWVVRREVALLFELLDHYGIAHDDELKWVRLAHKLASAHVPAFRFASRVGRPRKLKLGGGLAGLLSDSRSGPKGKPGRKRKDQMHKDLLTLVNWQMAQDGLSGRGAIKTALTKLLTEYAKERGRSVAATLARELLPWQKLYSRAKKKFPELAKNP